MNIVTFFSNEGVPQEGLSPTIRILKIDGTVIINDQAMSETGSGFYYYNFTGYDENEDYCIRADGTATLGDTDRYVYSTNETAGVGNLLKIGKNKWEIKGNQMIFYEDDNTTELYAFNLQTKNGTPTEKDVFKRVPA